MVLFTLLFQLLLLLLLLLFDGITICFGQFYHKSMFYGLLFDRRKGRVRTHIQNENILNGMKWNVVGLFCPFMYRNLSNQHVLNQHTKFIDCCSTSTGNPPSVTHTHAQIIHINGNIVLHCIEEKWKRVTNQWCRCQIHETKFAYWTSQLNTPWFDSPEQNTVLVHCSHFGITFCWKFLVGWTTER